MINARLSIVSNIRNKYRIVDYSICNFVRGVHIRYDVWIDAICINQNDDAEKSVQIARIGEVY